MTVLTEIGEMALSDATHDYFFRPSFANMTRIGSPAEIVERFTELHHSEAPRIMQSSIEAYGSIPSWLATYINSMGGEALKAGMIVMQACCEDDLTPMIGEWKGWRHCVVYRPGRLPKNDIIVLAQHLMQHGIVGKAKVRQLQRHETGERTTEFKAFDYISAARSHFGMNRTEASQLTMTEFQMLLAAKYPDQKGFTREEYDSIADEYLAKQAVRRENAKKK